VSQYNEISQVKAEEITGLELPRSVSERRKIFRIKLPYGVYVLPDNSEVLFNREYAPIDSFGDPVLDSDGKALEVNFESQYYFYDDGSFPSDNLEVLQRVSEVMRRKRNNPKKSVRDLAKPE